MGQEGCDLTTSLSSCSIQDIAILFNVIIIFLMFFNTFVFQAGLVNLLFHKFKGTILLSAAYLALSISFHVWVMVGWGGLGAVGTLLRAGSTGSTGSGSLALLATTPCSLQSLPQEKVAMIYHRRDSSVSPYDSLHDPAVDIKLELPHPSPFPKGCDILENPLSPGEAQQVQLCAGTGARAGVIPAEGRDSSSWFTWD